MLERGAWVARLAAKAIYRVRAWAARAGPEMPPQFAAPPEPPIVVARPKAMSIMSIVPNHLFLQFALAFVLCAIACGMILAGRLTVQRGTSTKTWPAASGVVIDS